MPYPLEDLPFGLCRRLSELAYPIEACNIQLAGFTEPIVTCESLHTANFLKNGRLRKNNEGNYVTLEDHKCYHVYHHVEFVDTTSFQFLLSIDLNVKVVSIMSCKVSAPLLQAIGTSLSKTQKLVEFHRCTFDDDVLPSTISDIFSNVEQMKFVRACPFKDNWPKLFTCRNMMSLVLESADAIINVKKNDLITFMQAQQENFQLDIAISDFHQVKQQVEELLSEPFVRNRVAGQRYRRLTFENSSPDEYYYYYL